MACNNMQPFDIELLKKEFSKRGLIAADVAEEFGYGRDYFSTCGYRGKISPVAIRFLASRYNIQYDEYSAHRASVSEEQSDKPSCGEIDYKQLYDTIYDAVYQAMRKAWNES